jgi:hypothetical protein
MISFWCQIIVPGNSLDLYSGGTRFEYRPGHRLSWLRFSWFSLVTPAKCRDSTSIRPRPLPSKSCAVRESSSHRTLCSLDTLSLTSQIKNDDCSAGEFLCCWINYYFSRLSLFWKNRVGLGDHVAVCVCVCLSPHINFWIPEPIFMKLGTYITAPEPISTA